jgi:2-polyprenyl-3-methyl-5-hydroxy-6-metoxy-1,4-benzoquinol methylase
VGEAGPAPVDQCRFCGGSSLTTVFDVPPWRVGRCRACGNYSTLPWPTDTDLEAAYSADYYREFGMWAGTAEEQDRLMTAYAVRVDLIERFQPPPGRLIEIGTAMGPLVAAARARGWDAVGYDTAPDAVEAGRRAYGEIVRLGDIHAARAEQAPAEAVVAYHVLEHVPDPRAFLSAAHALLRDRGLLVIEVPHVGSFDARWVPAVRERVLDLPRHLSHFTPRTLTALLGEQGFTIEGVDGTTSRLVHRLRNALARQGHGEAAAPTPPGGRPGLLPRVARRVLSGSNFCVYARKRTSRASKPTGPDPMV